MIGQLHSELSDMTILSPIVAIFISFLGQNFHLTIRRFRNIPNFKQVKKGSTILKKKFKKFLNLFETIKNYLCFHNSYNLRTRGHLSFNFALSFRVGLKFSHSIELVHFIRYFYSNFCSIFLILYLKYIDFRLNFLSNRNTQ